MLMANPNNPTGRLWTEEELRRLGELCLAHKVMILTDDIHCDFAMQGHRYVPLPSLSPELAEHTVLFTSTNKTFNLGGPQTATVVIGDAELSVADGLFCREIDGLFCRSSPDIIVRRRCVLSHKRRGWLQPSPSFRYSRNLALQDELYHPVINNGPAVLVCVDKRLGTGPVNQSRDAG